MPCNGKFKLDAVCFLKITESNSNRCSSPLKFHHFDQQSFCSCSVQLKLIEIIVVVKQILLFIGTTMPRFYANRPRLCGSEGDNVCLPISCDSESECVDRLKEACEATLTLGTFSCLTPTLKGQHKTEICPLTENCKQGGKYFIKFTCVNRRCQLRPPSTANYNEMDNDSPNQVTLSSLILTTCLGLLVLFVVVCLIYAIVKLVRKLMKPRDNETEESKHQPLAQHEVASKTYDPTTQVVVTKEQLALLFQRIKQVPSESDSSPPPTQTKKQRSRSSQTGESETDDVEDRRTSSF